MAALRRGFARRLGRQIAAMLVLAGLGACATVPGMQGLRERRAQAGLSTDYGWQSLQRSHTIVSGAASGDGADAMARHLAVEAAISGAPLVAGNQVRLLADGPATYRSMLDAIAQARRYIHMETYIFEDDAAGQRFADALMAARRRGVEVAVMVDAVGTLNTPRQWFERLRQGGIKVAVFNPVNPARAGAGWAPNQRNHRKLLVVDGQVGFLGGLNISSVYSSGSGSGSGSGRAAQEPGPAASRADTAPWRDTHIEVRGPAVAEIERVIQDGWLRQTGAPLGGGAVRLSVPAPGDLHVRILANEPNERDGYTVYLTLMSAFESARQSIHITMAYFVPDPAFVRVLADAARRGVDVALVLPGFSDSSLVWYAGRSHYQALLDAGVKLYERRDALLHAKTAVVDGVWSTVGSSNMDWRSFALNYELNAVIVGARFGAEMEALFERDRAAAVPIDPRGWADRGADDRFMEAFSRLFERWL